VRMRGASVSRTDSASREQYESVRLDVRHFLVVPGHLIPELETVVQSFPRYAVIAEPSALLELLVATEPARAAIQSCGSAGASACRRDRSREKLTAIRYRRLGRAARRHVRDAAR
jgi:hypothetical protein